MSTNEKNCKGITLIALVITILVLLILAGVSLSMLLGSNGLITKSVSATKEYEISSIKEILNLETTTENERIKQVRYMNTDEVNKIISGKTEQYKDKIGIYRTSPVYLGEPEAEESILFQNYGFTIIDMTPTEFKYYIELGILEDSVGEKKNIGRELQSSDFASTITIGDNTYGFGWYLIGNYSDEEKTNNTYQEHFDALNLKDTTHAPYLVNYHTGVVLSIDGMVMYQAQITVHSFNDNYDSNLSNTITYVNSFTNKTADSYGNLISTSKYTGPVTGYGGGLSIYQDNNGELQYNEDGALLLDGDNAIPVLEIDEKFNIEDNYSINVTVDGDYMQDCVLPQDSFPNTIVALSDDSSRYLSWIGVYNGFLHVYAFYSGSALGNIKAESTMKGFASINISKYQGSPINIQVTAVRGGDVNIYINGEKVKTIKAGNSSLKLQYTTLGDLRVGRNLKFVGKIYEFGIYGVSLVDSSIQSNWERSKKYVEK